MFDGNLNYSARAAKLSPVTRSNMKSGFNKGLKGLSRNETLERCHFW